MKYRKQLEWACGVIQRQYMQWKRRQFLFTLPLRFAVDIMSPTCLDWPTAPAFLLETNHLLRNIYHRWRVKIDTLAIITNFTQINPIFSATNTGNPSIRRLEIGCEKR